MRADTDWLPARVQRVTRRYRLHHRYHRPLQSQRQRACVSFASGNLLVAGWLTMTLSPEPPPRPTWRRRMTDSGTVPHDRPVGPGGRSPMADPPASGPAGVAMSGPDVLLATKLHVLRPPPGFVPRR